MVPFLIVISLVAILDWIAVGRGWKRVEYFAKPAVMVLLLGWLVVTGLKAVPLICFAIGIVFSLAGDVFLLLPSGASNRWFMLGLASFLLAHLAYIAGLNMPLPDASPFLSIAIALVLALAAARLLRRIIAGLLKKGQKGLVLPVEIYGVVITVMLLSAFLTLYNSHWNSGAAVLAALGAMLFYFSDMVLAWDRFVNPINHGRVYNMILYHLGQITLVAGVILQFGK